MYPQRTSNLATNTQRVGYRWVFSFLDHIFVDHLVFFDHFAVHFGVFEGVKGLFAGCEYFGGVGYAECAVVADVDSPGVSAVCLL